MEKAEAEGLTASDIAPNYEEPQEQAVEDVVDEEELQQEIEEEMSQNVVDEEDFAQEQAEEVESAQEEVEE